MSILPLARRVSLPLALSAALAFCLAGDANGQKAPQKTEGDVCQDAAALLKVAPTSVHLRSSSPEKPIGAYEPSRPTPAGWSYPTVQDFPNLKGLNWTVSLVDLDNDGVDDVRFTAVAGTAACETSYFFKRKAVGGYEVLLHLSGEATICGDDTILTLRHAGKNFLLWYGPFRSSVNPVEPDGKARRLCRISRQPGPARITSTCQEPVCRAVARDARKWPSVREEAPEPLSSDAAAVREVPLASLQIGDAEILNLYRGHPGLLVDVDNDGKPELVLMQWFGPRWGIGHEVLVADGAVFRPVDPRKRWPGWPEDSGAREGLLFMRTGGKTYVVAVTPSPTRPHQARVARIYLVDRSGARTVGEVEMKTDWQVSIDRQPSDRPW
ncbi:MAG: hypothetical protein A3K12_05555 [Candidatus Rokubacteria bacterium RIFCSPLOWO2_12_FULL_71_19]|nr:MAG: hypothetical protein A3K12_05555 [Candidatus Rokubacteria bacterium RIFCSPLOWO2_12_FULL_71_19]